MRHFYGIISILNHKSKGVDVDGYSLLYLIIGLMAFSFALTLHFFKKEMAAKMKYKEFKEDAHDGIFNRFSSNKEYGYSSTKGIAVIKSDGKYKIVSQSKLYDTSIDF